MKDEQQTRLHATVHGRVQGVGFRAYVIDTGLLLGVVGWARNRWDGTVEVVAEGDQQKLDKLLEAIRRGPRMSNVTEVKTEWGQASGEFTSFRMRPTI
jgi:acylphosphatase